MASWEQINAMFFNAWELYHFITYIYRYILTFHVYFTATRFFYHNFCFLVAHFPLNCSYLASLRFLPSYIWWITVHASEFYPVFACVLLSVLVFYCLLLSFLIVCARLLSCCLSLCLGVCLCVSLSLTASLNCRDFQGLRLWGEGGGVDSSRIFGETDFKCLNNFRKLIWTNAQKLTVARNH